MDPDDVRQDRFVQDLKDACMYPHRYVRHFLLVIHTLRYARAERPTLAHRQSRPIPSAVCQRHFHYRGGEVPAPVASVTRKLCCLVSGFNPAHCAAGLKRVLNGGGSVR